MKEQLDQVYNYFEGKFYLENMMKAANEQLERERHSGLIG